MSRAHADARPSPPEPRSSRAGPSRSPGPGDAGAGEPPPLPAAMGLAAELRGTHEWRVLREDIAANGIRTPLRILRNGWVIDGTHRYRIAQALGLETVPVQVVPLPLGSSAEDPRRAGRPAPDRADRRARGPGAAAPDATPARRAVPHPGGSPRVRRSARRRRERPGAWRTCGGARRGRRSLRRVRPSTRWRASTACRRAG